MISVRLLNQIPVRTLDRNPGFLSCNPSGSAHDRVNVQDRKLLLVTGI